MNFGLYEMLNQDVRALIKRQRDKMDALIARHGESYVLFGAGLLGRTALARLRKAEVEPLAFADNDERLWHQSIDGKLVVSPQEAVKHFGRKATFVVTVFTSLPVHEQLLTLGIQPVSFAQLAWRYSEAMLPYLAVDLPYSIYEQAQDVRAAMNVWADRASRMEYLSQLRWRTTLDPRVLLPHLPPDECYFPPDLFTLRPDEVFVDVGAYDGDSIVGFLARQPEFECITAIEPDPLNCERLQEAVAHLGNVNGKIIMRQIAIGEKRGWVHFDANGSATSAISSGGATVECDTLDNILTVPPTFIKADVQGAELDVLRGARRVIQEHLPILAICLYHKQEHLWQIPNYIKSLSPDYQLYLRRYSDECWEQICYAVPRGRL